MASGCCVDFSRQVMGAISWIVDSLLYDETIAAAEEEQRAREREATPEQREQDKEDGVDDQVGARCSRSSWFVGGRLLRHVFRPFIPPSSRSLRPSLPLSTSASHPLALSPIALPPLSCISYVAERAPLPIQSTRGAPDEHNSAIRVRLAGLGR